ncbi:hypothetical protein [Wohlfahrtiimonas chitiniclastica]|uniref:hypothetical protein n=1 Tax=Wohlfahrtiimonas chitiniclastica TaxID=400946 RepID=UPI000347A061
MAKIIYSNNLNDQDLKIQLRRARQLAYVEPWFQEFLPKKLKGRLFVASLGKRFWIIGALDPLSMSHFKQYHQKEVRQTLENHLNNISTKAWRLPEFYVQVMPKKSGVEEMMPLRDEPVPQLPVRSNKTLLTKPRIQNRSIEEILASMTKNAEKYTKP